MAAAARLTRTAELVANVAVVATAVVFMWSTFLGRTPSSPKGRAAARPQVEDIEKDALTTSIDQLATRTSLGQPVIVEFSDFSCPFCRKYANETLPLVRRQYLEARTVGYAFVNLPLEAVHPNAMTQAKIGTCAAHQEQFWRVHDVLFTSAESSINLENGVASQLKLNPAQFDSCMVTAEASVRRDMAEATRLGVAITPTLFVGRLSETGGVIKLMRRINGAVAFEVVRAAVESIPRSPS
jgi:protein-disulfide isomerase